jgi:hypothetical protein
MKLTMRRGPDAFQCVSQFDRSKRSQNFGFGRLCRYPGGLNSNASEREIFGTCNLSDGLSGHGQITCAREDNVVNDYAVATSRAHGTTSSLKSILHSGPWSEPSRVRDPKSS